ncbi:SMI1/KNR4 family protein [Jannaschia aquimarina]|uniref:Knr4/Smi1-like domain-containing protein n=1 Tax=Jannaschia aquimarina TaxID=935700 RepID=A0A0D1E995_9RHOB|nr:SMI1/KNR4 family protein [Jannaschia aquimarina]KIT14194.1 hypothetical protein jaqu_39870 [Jannaschia aquimarina]SNS47853.1 hypothetical protein SAMN05421775_101107 [Jannaschia aquimarina]
MTRIEALARDLDRLARKDRRNRVFGADGHKYRTQKWTLRQIHDLERRCPAPLPEDLREWLLRVGGGPAPCYGLAPEIYPFEPDDDPEAGAFRRLTDVTRADVQIRLDAAWHGPPDRHGGRNVPPELTTREKDGGPDLLFLGDGGCTFDFVMPLTGDLSGKVFYRDWNGMDAGETEVGGLLWPQGLARCDTHPWFEDARLEMATDAARMSGFLDWMEDWITESTYFVENLRRFNAQEKASQSAWLAGSDRSRAGLLSRLVSKLLGGN